MKKCILSILLVFPLIVNGQFTYTFDQSIPVQDVPGQGLGLAWAGGLNAAQYNTMDINGDDLGDLVLFDRMANKVITFLQKDSRYQYAPEYENLFPQLSNWLLLRDFNCDGKKDIFTADVLGVKVYLNTTSTGEPLQWKHFLFFDSESHSSSPVVLTKGSAANKVNLQLQYDDLPAISDIDNDGDLDILSFAYGGGSTIELHKNYGIERHGSCDSLDFERTTRSFGNVTVCDCGKFAFNDEPCPSHNGERIKHSVGKALLVQDIDGDNDPDIIFSKAECNNLFLLRNEGDVQNPVFLTSELFPSSHPVEFTAFPAAFYEDVDFDGEADLIATPNLFHKESNENNFKHSNWFYKNTGTAQLPAFSFIKNNFLQDEMIDVGDNAVPAFVDADGDGDLDLFIGQDNAENPYGNITFYENTGTTSQPAFALSSHNPVDLTQLLSYLVINIKPQFIDMSGDRRPDFVFTATNRSNNQTLLHYIINKSSSGVDFTGQTVHVVTAIPIQFSENAHIADVNRDGLPDVLIGKNTGSIEFRKNTGSAGSPAFMLEDGTFLGIGLGSLPQSPALTSEDLDGDGKKDLIIGDITGSLSIIRSYQEVENAPALLTEILYDSLSETYVAAAFAGKIWPTTANLFNSDKPAIIIGNMLGGLHVLRNHSSGTPTGEMAVEIYPTLLQSDQPLNIRTDRPVSVTLLSTMGQILTNPVVIQPNELYSVNLSHFARGLYLVRFQTLTSSFTRRIVIY